MPSLINSYSIENARVDKANAFCLFGERHLLTLSNANACKLYASKRKNSYPKEVVHSIIVCF